MHVCRKEIHMTRIDIVSGFLGAGKTTLIKKLLAEALQGEKIVLIENEFGEIGIDGGFLKDAGVQITEMNSGCICCSLVGDFGKALKQVVTEFAPDRVIIEPSGVGKLSDVTKAVLRAGEEVPMELGSSVAVVDGPRCKICLKNFGEFFADQVEYAGTILLSRTQNMTPDKVSAMVELLRQHNEKAPIITTPWDQLPAQKILEAMDGHSLATMRMTTTTSTRKPAPAAIITTMITSTAKPAPAAITMTTTTSTRKAAPAAIITTMITSMTTSMTTSTARPAPAAAATSITTPTRSSPAGAMNRRCPSPRPIWSIS